MSEVINVVCLRCIVRFADVAQLVEHPICNRAVASSILAVSSVGLRWQRGNAVGYPSGQREQTVNLPAYAFEGSNPSPTIKARSEERGEGVRKRG